ncbi:unnamed protein product, partial [Rotaria sp. Silwood1]
MSGSSTSAGDVILSKAFVVREINGQFQLWDLPRRPINPDDVLIRILYCGMCHGDIHAVKNEWKNSKYPMVPGHEIVGIVEKVGDQVTKVKQGDHVGVGFIVNSCRQCNQCKYLSLIHEIDSNISVGKKNLEQHCTEGCVGTFNSTEMDKKTTTYGGYSNLIVVVEHFVLKIPNNLPLDKVAPLLCAGITVYSALRQHNVGKDTRMGIVGFGGVGHLAIKYGVAMGADVTVFSTSKSKRDDAIKFGAKQFILSTDFEQINAATNKFDLIIDCVSAKHDLIHILSTLRFGGTFCMIGAPPTPLEVPPFSLIQKRLNVTGSFIGGMKETQEMLDFSGQHNIT